MAIGCFLRHETNLFANPIYTDDVFARARHHSGS